MLSSELEICLNEAFQAARESRHEFMTVEHLLLAIIDTPKVREILRACGADGTRLRKELKEFIDQTTSRLAVYLGPIAKVVAHKAARQARDSEEFVQLVAEHIGTQDRESFLKDVGTES